MNNRSQHSFDFTGPTRCVFDGADYSKNLDDARLTKQLGRVFEVMKLSQWVSLAEIEHRIFLMTGVRDPQASISAQLRHLKKKKFGAYHVQRRRRASVGTWEYRLNL